MEIWKRFWECLKCDEFKQSQKYRLGSIFYAKIISVIGYDFIDNIIEINIDQHWLIDWGYVCNDFLNTYWTVHNWIINIFVTLRTTVCLDIS